MLSSAHLLAGPARVGVDASIPISRPVIADADCPVADEAAARVVSIPVHPGVTEHERTRIVAEVRRAVAEV
jgi:dTDP-4-amino-4,6-dideoxygalactose transaminase